MKTINGEPKFVCNQCGRLYKQKTGLSQHIRYECGKEPQFSCPMCPYKAKRKTTMRCHMLFKHKEELGSTNLTDLQ